MQNVVLQSTRISLEVQYDTPVISYTPSNIYEYTYTVYASSILCILYYEVVYA